jgi:hypothetical protein
MCLPVSPYKIEKEWEHAGLKCAVTQNRQAMNRCGYVRVPPGHPAHGKEDELNVDVHGGLTFSRIEPCAHEDGTGWWLGFDCAHSGDSMLDPNIAREDLPIDMRSYYDIHHKYPWPDGEHYWTQSEVEAECEFLAEQLATYK